jgi:putative oxidoreductase
MNSLASLVLRLGLGVIFAAHGTEKVFGAFGGSGIQGFAKMLEGLGFVPATPWAYVAAYTELLGGISLIVGAFTRAWSVLLLVLIIVATVKVHLKNGFFLTAGGFEYNLIILCGLISLIILGAGKFSLTRKL